jgi:hypothetical protein
MEKVTEPAGLIVCYPVYTEEAALRVDDVAIRADVEEAGEKRGCCTESESKGPLSKA